MRSEISTKIGHALAETYDRRSSVLLLAVRQAHPITAAPGPEPGGSVINLGSIISSTLRHWLVVLLSCILDEKNVPSQDVLLCCLPTVLCFDFSGRY